MRDLFTSLAGLMVGAIGTYLAFYVRGALARREQIARSLADFYASAATVYYAGRDYTQTSYQEEDNNVALYKLFDQHYKEFLSSSTVLASLIPPALREEVLSIEDKWDQINEKRIFAVSEKGWFDTLDAIRYKILDAISYNRLTDPFWKLR